MNSIPPDVLQIIAGGAGAFLGGLLLVWRAQKSLPAIINNVVQVFCVALKEAFVDDMRQVVRSETQDLRDSHAELKERVISLEDARQRRSRS